MCFSNNLMLYKNKCNNCRPIYCILYQNHYVSKFLKTNLGHYIEEKVNNTMQKWGGKLYLAHAILSQIL